MGDDERVMTRREVLRGGLVGLGIGVGLFALGLLFLFRRDQPSDVVGVFVPTAVAILSTGLGITALVPLVATGAHGTRALSRALRALAAFGVLVTGAGLVVGELPWTLFTVAPLLAVWATLRDAGRLARAARS
ncbi:hypothetical protein [Nocardioides solisilvae]|uniref:hypothetical protein n=1 Tax=Nocardioides solisilvae TaxID=1542435 RepID=UPI000D74FD4C|nr:hypothetical protein [Nocardioides solisilvae]